MTLKIIETTNNDKKTILVKFAKQELIIDSNSTKWNSEGINEFLINLAAAIPDGENIEIDFDKENKDEIYLHIVDLFSEFAKEYNSFGNN